MPLEIRQFSLDKPYLDQLGAVLKQDSDVQTTLEGPLIAEETQLWVGIFNARPVSVALLQRQGSDWTVTQLVVHPATRGRGVAAETLRLAAKHQSFSWPDALNTLAERAGLSGLTSLKP